MSEYTAELGRCLRPRERPCVLARETPQARQILHTLLAGRIVFTPRSELRSRFLRTRAFCGRLSRRPDWLTALESPSGFERLWMGNVHRRILLAV
jgi:hypothetical protein